MQWTTVFVVGNKVRHKENTVMQHMAGLSKRTFITADICYISSWQCAIQTQNKETWNRFLLCTYEPQFHTIPLQMYIRRWTHGEVLPLKTEQFIKSLSVWSQWHVCRQIQGTAKCYVTIKSQLDGECCIRDPHIQHANIPISEVMFENVLNLTVITKQTLHINVWFEREQRRLAVGSRCDHFGSRIFLRHMAQNSADIWWPVLITSEDTLWQWIVHLTPRATQREMLGSGL